MELAQLTSIYSIMFPFLFLFKQEGNTFGAKKKKRLNKKELEKYNILDMPCGTIGWIPTWALYNTHLEGYFIKQEFPVFSEEKDNFVKIQKSNDGKISVSKLPHALPVSRKKVHICDIPVKKFV